MRHQAKPFAVEVRKNRRSPADAPTPVIAESEAVPAKFQEAEKLFRRAAQQPAATPAIEAGRPRTILPDLSSPLPAAQPARAERLRKSARRNEDAPADLPPPTPSRRRRPPADDAPVVADAPAGRKDTGSAPPKTSSSATASKATAAKVVVEVRPAAVAVAPRQRDPRPARGEFQPGQRWKRRLAPLLR